jgi:hypothetical protein
MRVLPREREGRRDPERVLDRIDRTVIACSALSVIAGVAAMICALLAGGCANGENTGAAPHDGSAPGDAARDAMPPQGDAIPMHAISFFSRSSCPEGWIQYGPGEGRFLIPVADASETGTTSGEPLANREDRAHGHTVSATIDVSPTSFAGVAGGGNGGVAGAGSAALAADVQPASTGLPYVQLLVCRKLTPAREGGAELPRGTLLFFGTASCPDGWSQPSLTRGRLLVGLPEGAAPGLAFGGDALLAEEVRTHAHAAAGDVTTASHGIALASGCCADGYAQSGTYPFATTSDAVAHGLPTLHVLQCRKD